MSEPTAFQKGFSREPLLYPTAVYGLRHWMLPWDEQYPKGQAGKYWPLPQKTAYCNAAMPECKRVGVPNPNCRCGIYAYFDPNVVIWGQFVVTGVVEGSGKALIGERGFRAAQAKVLAVSPRFGDYWGLFSATPESIARLAMRWEIPAFDNQQDMLREFPLTEPARDFPGLITAGGKP